MYLRFLYLLILTALLEGCAAEIYNFKLENIENNISAGRPAGEQLKAPAALMPPSLAARQTIAMAMVSILNDKYDEGSGQDIRKGLVQIRKNPLVPRYLHVEAGYVLELFDKIESLKHQNRSTVQQREKCLQDSDRMKQENDRIKKETDELKYKLQKIEEIHINTEKKRGMQ